MSTIRNKLTYTQMIVLSFFCIIFIGALVLCLPISSREGIWSPFIDAMFTATSATCVTGLIVFDTFTHWSAFGQVVILVLIQIGGLGVMTIIAMIALFLKRRITLGERRLLMQSTGSLEISGVVRLIHRILTGTVIAESCGAILLSFVFVPDMGFGKGIWNAVFHSVSAFCNAGFDLMGRYAPFASFSNTDYAMNPIVNLTIMSLIVVGGIGFIVWRDIATKRFKFSEYEVHSKIVLVTTACLIVFGSILFFIFEYDHTLAGFTLWEKILASMFHSVSPRTAGFSTLNLGLLSNSGALLTILLMFIGGSPGSTAGGIKTTTFTVLLLSALASAKRYGSITVFKRKLDENTVVQASTIATIYVCCVSIAVLLICAFEPLPFIPVAFEAVSAIGTVGLSTGITPSLCAGSKVILMVLMFAGRVGGLSLMLVLAERRISVPIERPTGKILIG
ncbi:MAG: TrkH family potassium uptake protein [Oscillospiraceae bacterium]